MRLVHSVVVLEKDFHGVSISLSLKKKISLPLSYQDEIFRQGVSQRQQTIVYITNDTNPFEENWATQVEGYFVSSKLNARRGADYRATEHDSLHVAD